MATINGYQEIEIKYKDGHTKNITIHGRDFWESEELWEWQNGELVSCQLCFFATVDEVEAKLQFVAFENYNYDWNIKISVNDDNFIEWKSIDDCLGYDLDWLDTSPPE